jgi:hypothetical protein
MSMPDPLPSDIVARLRSDSTAALVASLILAGSVSRHRFVGAERVQGQRQLAEDQRPG